jgi:hypothetical protein
MAALMASGSTVGLPLQFPAVRIAVGPGKSLNSSTWCSGESAGVGGGRREFEPP